MSLPHSSAFNWSQEDLWLTWGLDVYLGVICGAPKSLSFFLSQRILKLILLVNFVQVELKWKRNWTRAKFQLDTSDATSATQSKRRIRHRGGGLETLHHQRRNGWKGSKLGDSVTILSKQQGVAWSYPASESHVTNTLSPFFSACHFHSGFSTS